MGDFARRNMCHVDEPMSYDVEPNQTRQSFVQQPRGNQAAIQSMEAAQSSSAPVSEMQERDWCGVGMLTQENPQTGSNINAMYIGAGRMAEGQYGGEAGMFRGTAAGEVGGVNASGTMNVFNANATVGNRSADGSTGVYGAVGATAISGETTVGNGATELTVGGGVGVGAGFGLGIRDKDNDGRPELCARVEGKLGLGANLGFCIEDNMRTPDSVKRAAEEARSTGVYIPPPGYRGRYW